MRHQRLEDRKKKESMTYSLGNELFLKSNFPNSGRCAWIVRIHREIGEECRQGTFAGSITTLGRMN